MTIYNKGFKIGRKLYTSPKISYTFTIASFPFGNRLEKKVHSFLKGMYEGATTTDLHREIRGEIGIKSTILLRNNHLYFGDYEYNYGTLLVRTKIVLYFFVKVMIIVDISDSRVRDKNGNVYLSIGKVDL